MGLHAWPLLCVFITVAPVRVEGLGCYKCCNLEDGSTCGEVALETHKMTLVRCPITEKCFIRRSKYAIYRGCADVLDGLVDTSRPGCVNVADSVLCLCNDKDGCNKGGIRDYGGIVLDYAQLKDVLALWEKSGTSSGVSLQQSHQRTKRQVNQLRCECPTGPAGRRDCTGLGSGFYQDCFVCDKFFACQENLPGQLSIRSNLSCPLGFNGSLQWDDRLKACNFVSTTCRKQ